MNELKTELHKLYSDASKHSVYQNVPDFVSAELGYAETIDESWRGDRPRLAYLLASRAPAAGEHWMDFGANTGFFTLSLAKQFPQAMFTAVEANPNHASFIARVAKHFALDNVEVIQQAVGLNELEQLPRSDFLLHLNVLHHAGHDFDGSIVPNKSAFPQYAQRYLAYLRKRTTEMLFQMGSNWGGDKNQPFVDFRDDLKKLRTFYQWLSAANWRIRKISYPGRIDNGSALYENLPPQALLSLEEKKEDGDAILVRFFQTINLDQFQGEFYRRPLIICKSH